MSEKSHPYEGLKGKGLKKSKKEDSKKGQPAE